MPNKELTDKERSARMADPSGIIIVDKSGKITGVTDEKGALQDPSESDQRLVEQTKPFTKLP